MYKATTTDLSQATPGNGEEVNRNRKGVQDDREKHRGWKGNSTSRGKFKMWYNKNACNH